LRRGADRQRTRRWRFGAPTGAARGRSHTTCESPIDRRRRAWRPWGPTVCARATHPSRAHPEAVRRRRRRAAPSSGRARTVSRPHRPRTDLCVHRVRVSASRVRATAAFLTHNDQCTIGGRAPRPPSMAAPRGFGTRVARSTHPCVHAARDGGDRRQSARDCVPCGPAITDCSSPPCFYHREERARFCLPCCSCCAATARVASHVVAAVYAHRGKVLTAAGARARVWACAASTRRLVCSSLCARLFLMPHTTDYIGVPVRPRRFFSFAPPLPRFTPRAPPQRPRFLRAVTHLLPRSCIDNNFVADACHGGGGIFSFFSIAPTRRWQAGLVQDD